MTTADAPPNNTAETPPYTHYLLSLTTYSMPVRGDQLAIALRDCFESLGVAALSATSYTSTMYADPRNVGLKDTWLTLPSEDRDKIQAICPHLKTAIDLICGIRKEDYR